MTTKIEWTDETWNPVTGCSPTSEGCANCYAQRMAQRLKGRYGYPSDDPFRPGTIHPDKFDINMFSPGKKVFVCSMGDLFHEAVDFSEIHEVWDIMKAHPDNIFMILTKRPERMKQALDIIYSKERFGWAKGFWDHVWLGVTAENQAMADERIPILLQIPAAVRFVSVEPMLGKVDIPKHWFMDYYHIGGDGKESGYQGIDWVIAGKETGPGARPCELDWIRELKDQTFKADVPFFYKNNDGMIDGVEYRDYPTMREL